MASPPEIASDDPAPPHSRWARATSGGGEDGREALRELAGSYWYCVYAWWRRAGLEAAQAATATLASFTRWLDEAPPLPEDSGAARMREWLPARLAEVAAVGVKLQGAAAIEIEAAWAAQRFADEPPGEPDAIFQRRWALTILEFTTTTLQAEYAARGEDALFAELLPFAGFEPGDDQRYASAAARTGRTSGAMRKAVFDFRSRQREVLRAYVGDTVADPAEIDSEMTALLCACEAAGVQMTPLPGMETPAAPLPTAIRALRPDEVFARAMQSVRMTHAGPGGWTPPTVEEAARLFPSYEVLKLLGRGGMGAVYQARQIELDRLVAIKLLPLEVSVDQDFADRFRREARAMAKLDHPNIIAVYDFGTTTEGHLFFAMAYVEGANLHELIHAKGADAGAGLSPARALEIITGVCDALAFAHGRGIVHRDIKPANVMVSTEGQVKVADFGLARLTDPAAESLGHTVTGTVMGTPAYMAPEQMRGMAVDHRADIYSVGVMLYEALCRETPQGIFDPPSTRIGCDPAIDAIVIKAMQQAPERRYQSTQEMKVATANVHMQITTVVKVEAAVAVSAPIKAPPASPAGPAGVTAAAARRSRKPIFIGAAAALAIVAGGAIWSGRVGVPPAGSGVSPERTSDTTKTPSDSQMQPQVRAGGTPAPAGGTPTLPETTSAAATKDAPFVNTLGMKFVPVPITGGPTGGQRVLFSVWETRVQDYEIFAKETKRDWPKVEFEQEPSHPAVNLTWEDSLAFCAWLTTREQNAGKLPVGQSYRLPSDHEWSCAAGIGERENASLDPAQKSDQPATNNLYPWGTAWPPPKGSGNYSGEEAKGKEVIPDQRFLEGYRDGYAATSPVGSFAPNAMGLFDLSGNAREWCEDWLEPNSERKVGRGGSFKNFRIRMDLFSSFRGNSAINTRDLGNGFRVVLADSKPAQAAIPAEKSIGTKPAMSGEVWQDVLADVEKLALGGGAERTPEGLRFADAGTALPKLGVTPQTDGAIRMKAILGDRRTQLYARSSPSKGLYLAYAKNESTIVLGGYDVPTKMEWRLTEFPLQSPLSKGKEYQLELRTIGPEISVKLNGEMLGSATDSTYSAGDFLVRVLPGKGEAAVVQSLEVLDLSLPEKTATTATSATPSPKPSPTATPAPSSRAPALPAGATAAPVSPTLSPSEPPASTTSTSQSVTGKWLAEQEPQWQAAFASEVVEPFAKGLAALQKQYLATVETQLAAATKAAKLEDAVALRAERQRLTGGGEIPATDDETTPALVKTLRTSYRATMARLLSDRATKAKTVQARYDAILAQNQDALTQRQRLDEALELKAKRDALSAGWLQPATGAGAAAGVATPVPATPKPAGGPASPSAAVKEPKLKPREAAERLLALGAIFSHGPQLNPNVDTSGAGQAVNAATRVEKATQIPSGRFSISQVEFPSARAGGGSTTDAEWEILESLPELVTVRFSRGSDVTDAAIEKLRACRKLQMIKIEGAGRFTGATFGALAPLPELIHISLFSCPAFGDTGAKALSQLRNLQNLYLAVSVTDTGLAAVAELPQLKQCTLGQGTKITGTGLSALTKAKSLQSLTFIHFGAFGADAVQALASFPALEDLTLNGSTPVTDANLPSLAALPKLRRLTLQNTAGVTGEGFAQWPVRPAMENLLIWTNQSANDDALRAIVTAFPKLTRLDITASAPKVTPDGLAILSKLRQLRGLTLYGDAVDDAGLAHLARCDLLTQINIGSARATEAGVQSLAKLRSLQDLTWLNPPVTDAMLKSYAKLSKLTTFRIGKEAPAETEQKLKAALPKVAVVR